MIRTGMRDIIELIRKHQKIRRILRCEWPYFHHWLYGYAVCNFWRRTFNHVYSPNSIWLVTSRHVRRVERVETSVSSRAVRQARHSQNAWARLVDRVETWRDEPSGIWAYTAVRSFSRHDQGEETFTYLLCFFLVPVWHSSVSCILCLWYAS